MEYEISELGRSLAPLFATLAEWSVNLDKVDQARRDYDARERIRAVEPDPKARDTDSRNPHWMSPSTGPATPVQIWSLVGRRPLLAAGNANGDTYLC